SSAAPQHRPPVQAPPAARPPAAAPPSFVAQAFDGIQFRRAARGIVAEEDADDDRGAGRGGHGPRLDDCIQRAAAREADGNADPQQHADAATDPAEEDGFDQELPQDVAVARADGLPDADLARALRHRDQHDVHDADAAHEQRYPRDAA